MPTDTIPPITGLVVLSPDDQQHLRGATTTLSELLLPSSSSVRLTVVYRGGVTPAGSGNNRVGNCRVVSVPDLDHHHRHPPTSPAVIMVQFPPLPPPLTTSSLLEFNVLFWSVPEKKWLLKQGVPVRVVSPPPPKAAIATPSLSSVTIPSKKLLVIGAGGIGCELVKCLVLVGFRRLHLVDLDTIDATNLNRQFLFRTWHVDMGKAAVVAQSMKDWFSHMMAVAVAPQDNNNNNATTTTPSSSPNQLHPLDITYQQANIKDPSFFDTDFFDGFDMVLNGLDNVSARKHVNRMCMQVSTIRKQRLEDKGDGGGGGSSIHSILPLVESGTMGFNGQMVPILRGMTACYDCVPKGPDKVSFAVCTIHARPTTMVHCVHYAKELYDKIFGPSVIAFTTTTPAAAEKGSKSDSGDEKEEEGGSSGEMGFLQGLFTIKGLAGEGDMQPSPSDDERLLKLLFHDKIAELIEMKGESSWGVSGPPVPHDATTIRDVCQLSHDASMGLIIDDFQVPSAPYRSSLALLRTSLKEASKRALSGNGGGGGQPQSHPFKKEDPIAVRFVAAVSNLRASSFHISPQSLHEITTIAGSIIPAISSTNAIVAASVANAAVQVASALSLQPSPSQQDAVTIPSVYVRKVPLQQRRRVFCNTTASPPQRIRFETNQRLLVHSVAAPAPCPDCLICSPSKEARVVTIMLNATLYTMGQFVARVLQSQLSLVAPGVQLNDSILYEHGEYEGLKDAPLTRWIVIPPSEGSPSPSSLAAAASPPSATFFVEDLQQDVEWQVRVVHDIDHRTDLAHFAINSQEMTPLAERQLLTSSASATTTPTTNATVRSEEGYGQRQCTGGGKRPREDEVVEEDVL